MKLRDYQQRDINRLRLAFAQGHRRVLYRLPTGGGKTVTFSSAIAMAVGRWEGCRILRRWERRARARCAHEGRRCNVQARALAAYNAGVAGLRGQSREGMSYARAVLALRGR